MDVEPYERGRFRVRSHGVEHVVDCLCLRGNGSCDCQHYLGRLKGEIEEARRQGTFRPADKFRCPHIRAAREKLLELFIAELIKRYPDTNDTEI